MAFFLIVREIHFLKSVCKEDLWTGYNILVGNLKWIYHLEDLDVDGTMMLKSYILGWTESFCVFQKKSQSFFNIFTIFNQLYDFHCLLLLSHNVSQAFQFRPCKNSLVFLRRIFENAKTFRSTQ
jgi:hypothetical protein